MAKTILKIRSTAASFRRAGIEFNNKTDTTVDPSTLSKEQLKQLREETALVIVEGEVEDDDTSEGPKVHKDAAALAKDKGLDLSTVTGTGSKGAITKADVEAALKKLTP